MRGDKDSLPYRLCLSVRQPKQHTSCCLFSPWHSLLDWQQCGSQTSQRGRSNKEQWVKSRQSGVKKPLKRCNCEMKRHTWIDLFWFSAMKGTRRFKKTGKEREEQCVEQRYCLPWQHTFQPQILCFSHVPAIISTQKTPERLLWQHFKGFPTSLLKPDDRLTNGHGYVFWHQLFGLWSFNVTHTEV